MRRCQVVAVAAVALPCVEARRQSAVWFESMALGLFIVLLIVVVGLILCECFGRQTVGDFLAVRVEQRPREKYGGIFKKKDARNNMESIHDELDTESTPLPAPFAPVVEGKTEEAVAEAKREEAMLHLHDTDSEARLD